MTEKQYSIVGVDNVYYALVTQDDDDAYAAGTPIKLTQTMELKGTTEIDSQTQWADNAAHDVVDAEGNTNFEVIAPNIGEDVAAILLGEVHDVATGRVFDDADPTQAPYFALGYRFKKRNGSYRYRWYLKCRATKPDEEAQSESDKVNLKTTTLKITAVKTNYKFDVVGDASRMQGVKRVHGDEDLTNFDGASWFSAVQVPVAGTPDTLTLTPVPTDGATGISVSADQTLTFSNPMDGNVLNGIALVQTSDDSVVPASITINAARTVVTINPTSNLNSAEEYYIVVVNATDIYGQTLANTLVNFTTA